jgi:hypothetical protein
MEKHHLGLMEWTQIHSGRTNVNITLENIEVATVSIIILLQIHVAGYN